MVYFFTMVIYGINNDQAVIPFSSKRAERMAMAAPL
jgi:hypothetical protein